MFWRWKNKKKVTSPEEFFADCDGDIIKMIDKIESMWVTGATFSHLLYLHKKILQSYKENLQRTAQ